MKDENGIEICCKNCNDDVAITVHIIIQTILMMIGDV